jgi:uncharacterized protein involved in tellurium resistance
MLYFKTYCVIELRKRGESHRINLSKNLKSQNGFNCQVKMTWKTPVDLDLHAYAIDSNNNFIHVYFAQKKSPCSNILLDQDAGVGNTAGDNEENLTVSDLSKVKRIIFVANIFRFFGNLFSSGVKFSEYDGQIYINTLGEEIKVLLNSTDIGRWAVIAMIDNENGVPVAKNINSILKSEPNKEYLNNLL